MTHPAGDDQGDGGGQGHADEADEVIRVDEGAADAPFVIRRTLVPPHRAGVCGELVNGVNRGEAGDDNDRDAKSEGEFLAVEITEDGEEENGVNDDLDQFEPGDVLDFGVPVADEGVGDEGEGGPA